MGRTLDLWHTHTSPKNKHFKMLSSDLHHWWCVQRFHPVFGLLTCAWSGGAGLAAAALAAVASGSALISQDGRGAAGSSGAHCRPRDAAVGGAQQSARRTWPAAGWDRHERVTVWSSRKHKRKNRKYNWDGFCRSDSRWDCETTFPRLRPRLSVTVGPLPALVLLVRTRPGEDAGELPLSNDF